MHDHFKMVAPTEEPGVDSKTLTACLAAALGAGLGSESLKEPSILLVSSQRRAKGRRCLQPCKRVCSLDMVEELRPSTVLLAVRELAGRCLTTHSTAIRPHPTLAIRTKQRQSGTNLLGDGHARRDFGPGTRYVCVCSAMASTHTICGCLTLKLCCKGSTKSAGEADIVQEILCRRQQSLGVRTRGPCG